MLSIEELNNFKNRNDFVNLLKKKLPKKRFEKIIVKSDYNNQIILSIFIKIFKNKRYKRYRK